MHNNYLNNYKELIKMKLLLKNYNKKYKIKMNKFINYILQETN